MAANVDLPSYAIWRRVMAALPAEALAVIVSPVRAELEYYEDDYYLLHGLAFGGGVDLPAHTPSWERAQSRAVGWLRSWLREPDLGPVWPEWDLRPAPPAPATVRMFCALALIAAVVRSLAAGPDALSDAMAAAIDQALALGGSWQADLFDFLKGVLPVADGSECRQVPFLVSLGCLAMATQLGDPAERAAWASRVWELALEADEPYTWWHGDDGYARLWRRHLAACADDIAGLVPPE